MRPCDTSISIIVNKLQRANKHCRVVVNGLLHRVALSEFAGNFKSNATHPPSYFKNSHPKARTCGGDELALERRLEAEFGAEAAVAAVVDEDVVRAERREAHAARVAALSL